MGRRKLTEFTSPQVAIPLSEAEQRVKAMELAQMCGEIDKLRADAADHARAQEDPRAHQATAPARRMRAHRERDAQLELGAGEKSSKRNGAKNSDVNA